MEKAECSKLLQRAEDAAKKGNNDAAADIFFSAAQCWLRWEFFSKAAQAYERSYEHAMLAHRYSEAAESMKAAGHCWIRQSEHEKFEIDYQIAAEAYIYAAEEKKDPTLFMDGAFCAIVGGELDLSRQLIHAAAETTRGKMKELINLSLMLIEYHFGDADTYIDAALTRALDKEKIRNIKDMFLLAFAGFVRSSLESEVAVSVKSLAESTGLDISKTRRYIERGIELGHIPAYIDPDGLELILDSDRFDASDLQRRKRPILSRDLKDPGAWDTDLED
jgi:hypothetical protein